MYAIVYSVFEINRLGTKSFKDIVNLDKNERICNNFLSILQNEGRLSIQ